MYYTSRGFPDIRLHHADALSSQTERTVNSGNIFYREFVRDRSAEIAIRDVQSDYVGGQYTVSNGSLQSLFPSRSPNSAGASATKLRT